MEAASYGGMTTGFGNFFRMTPPGWAFDWDKLAADGTCTTDCDNDTVWSEFGCKTGMGKRSQRAGVGNQDRFGFGLCLGCASFNAMQGDMSTGWWQALTVWQTPMRVFVDCRASRQHNDKAQPCKVHRTMDGDF
jgi:hypothetical protein